MLFAFHALPDLDRPQGPSHDHHHEEGQANDDAQHQEEHHEGQEWLLRQVRYIILYLILDLILYLISLYILICLLYIVSYQKQMKEGIRSLRTKAGAAVKIIMQAKPPNAATTMVTMVLFTIATSAFQQKDIA